MTYKCTIHSLTGDAIVAEIIDDEGLIAAAELAISLSGYCAAVQPTATGTEIVDHQ